MQDAITFTERLEIQLSAEQFKLECAEAMDSKPLIRMCKEQIELLESCIEFQQLAAAEERQRIEWEAEQAGFTLS